MNCPNCGNPHEPGTTICPFCGAPLGNALYKPAEPRPSGKKKGWIIFLCVLLVLSCLGFAGYLYYLKAVEKECLKVTETFMECAGNLDFTPLGRDNLPPPLSEDPDLKKVLEEKVDTILEEKGLSALLSAAGIGVDYDAVFNQLMSRSAYSVTGADTTWNRCTVTLTTSNVSWPAAIDHLKEKITAADETGSPATWWEGLKGWLNSILGGGQEEAAQEEEPSTISKELQEILSAEEVNTVTGTIVFGIRDMRWTILSADSSLLYNFYGFPTVNP